MAYVSLGPSGDMPLTIAVVSSSATTISVVSAVAGSVTAVYKLFLVVGGSTNITFLDGTTGLSGALPLTTNGSITLDLDGTPWFVTTPNAAFQIGNSGNLQVSGSVYYQQKKFMV